VITVIARPMPSKRQNIEVFRVLRHHAFVAATMKSTTSMAATPASMLRTKTARARGTSTKPRPASRPFGSGQFQVSEAQINGDAATFLLLQAVGIDAGKALTAQFCHVDDGQRYRRSRICERDQTSEPSDYK